MLTVHATPAKLPSRATDPQTEDKYQALLQRAVRLRHRIAEAAVMRQQEKLRPLFTEVKKLPANRRLILESGLGILLNGSDVWSAVLATEVSL